MSLPYNFAQPPHEEAHRYFRNICRAFIKAINRTAPLDELQEAMLRFLDASKQMHWQHPKTSVYHKEEGEKAVDKVCSEFKRYVGALQSEPQSAQTQDLLDALQEVERLIRNFQVE